MDSKDKEILVAIWSKAVDTQMHFNEMSVKARQFGLAFVAAALGLAIVMLSRGEEFSIFVPICDGFELHGTVLIILASAFALFAVSLLDLRVYHKMLRGAVTFGEDFEQQYMREIFQLNKGMTQAISHYSRYEDASKVEKSGGYRYEGIKEGSALAKIRNFYRVSIGTLVASALLLFIVTAHFGQPPVVSHPSRGAATSDGP
jgi:hypothetical protein